MKVKKYYVRKVSYKLYEMQEKAIKRNFGIKSEQM